MKNEWKKYYVYLENLRKSGIVNMFGAIPYLTSEFNELTENSAGEILSNWMKHYSEIKEAYYND